MAVKIAHDPGTPTVAVEWMLTRPLADFDIEDVDKPTPRDVDEVLVSQGFRDLVDEARSLLEGELAGSGLEIVQFTGAICHAGQVYRPGLWLVLRETDAAPNEEMSAAARARVSGIAERLRGALHLC